MLFTSDGHRFANGRVHFFDDNPGQEEGTAKIYVKIEPGDTGLTLLAQVDTGAAWSVLEPEVADAMELLDEEGEPLNRSQFLLALGHTPLGRSDLVNKAPDPLKAVFSKKG